MLIEKVIDTEYIANVIFVKAHPPFFNKPLLWMKMHTDYEFPIV